MKSVQQFCGSKHLIRERGQRKMFGVAEGYRKASTWRKSAAEQ